MAPLPIVSKETQIWGCPIQVDGPALTQPRRLALHPPEALLSPGDEGRSEFDDLDAGERAVFEDRIELLEI